MNFEVKVLETDGELLQLISLVIDYSNKTDASLYQSLYEISQGFKNPTFITMIAKKDGLLTGYVSGMFLTPSEFLATQAFSKDRTTNINFFTLIQKKLNGLGCKKIFGHTQLDPSVFEKYGFKFDRYLLIKEIEKEEE
jgi:hypothetical protein